VKFSRSSRWSACPTGAPVLVLHGYYWKGLFQFITGIWLMYCTHAMTLDLALGYKAWVESRHDKCRNNYEHESYDQQTARNFQSARLSRKTRIVRSYGKGSYL
jgi:hypothetical protein